MHRCCPISSASTSACDLPNRHRCPLAWMLGCGKRETGNGIPSGASTISVSTETWVRERTHREYAGAGIRREYAGNTLEYAGNTLEYAGIRWRWNTSASVFPACPAPAHSLHITAPTIRPSINHCKFLSLSSLLSLFVIIIVLTVVIMTSSYSHRNAYIPGNAEKAYSTYSTRILKAWACQRIILALPWKRSGSRIYVP